MLFSNAKAKKPSSFFTSLRPKHESMKPNLSPKAMKIAPNENYFTEEQQIYTYTHTYIKVINKFEIFFLS